MHHSSHSEPEVTALSAPFLIKGPFAKHSLTFCLIKLHSDSETGMCRDYQDFVFVCLVFYMCCISLDSRSCKHKACIKVRGIPSLSVYFALARLVCVVKRGEGLQDSKLFCKKYNIKDKKSAMSLCSIVRLRLVGAVREGNVRYWRACLVSFCIFICCDSVCGVK